MHNRAGPQWYPRVVLTAGHVDLQAEFHHMRRQHEDDQQNQHHVHSGTILISASRSPAGAKPPRPDVYDETLSGEGHIL